MAIGSTSKRKSDEVAQNNKPLKKVKIRKKKDKDEFVFTMIPPPTLSPSPAAIPANITHTPRGTTKLHPLLHPEQSPARQIPLHSAETPIQAKNQEFRHGPPSSSNPSLRRRPSLERRGRRASSIGSGVEATPHPTLPDTTLYRHIDPSGTHSDRLLTLLNWAAQRQQLRSIADIASEPIETVTSRALHSFVAELSSKSIPIQILDHSHASTTAIKLANPENLVLKAKMLSLDDWVASLTEEDSFRRQHAKRYASFRDNAARSASAAAQRQSVYYNLSAVPLQLEAIHTEHDLVRLGHMIQASATEPSRRRSDVSSQDLNPGEINVEAELGVSFANLRLQTSKAQIVTHRIEQLVRMCDSYSSYRMSAAQQALAQLHKSAHPSQQSAAGPPTPAQNLRFFLTSPSYHHTPTSSDSKQTFDLLRLIAREDVANRRH